MNNSANNEAFNNAYLKVILKRGSITESIHRVHAVICDEKGRVLMKWGEANYQSFIRSALKPFQVLPFINSGASETYKHTNESIAIACGSHSGTTKHARESFKILWNADIRVECLLCPKPHNSKSKLQHNCSGKHSAFLATCKKMGWPLDSYLLTRHPLHQEIFRRVSDLLCIPVDEFISEKDDCGTPTLLLQLNQMAVLYANLSKSNNAEFEKINRAFSTYPEFIAGEGRFDTEILKRGHHQIISKGGSEGIQCIGRIGEGLGLAIKVEDGSKRAKHAVAIHLLRQLEWMTPSALDEVEEIVLNQKTGVKIQVQEALN